METTDSSNCHTGHRKRLRQLIDRVGLKNLSDVQIIEQLLTVTNARKDTNEIAHRLLEKFGSIARILNASYDELIEIPGVGDITAKLITYIPQLFEIYMEEQNSTKNYIKNYNDLYNLVYPYFKNEKNECVYVAYMDKNDKLSFCEKIAEGDFKEVQIDIPKLLCKLIKRSEKKLVFAHNHPYGSVSPSKQDYDTHCLLSTTLNPLGFEIYDSIIINKDCLYSIKNTMKVECNPNTSKKWVLLIIQVICTHLFLIF